MTERDIPSLKVENNLLFQVNNLQEVEMRDNALQIAGYVEGHPNKIFTVMEILPQLSWLVSPRTCHNLLRNNRMVEPIIKKGRIVAYKSLAPALPTVWMCPEEIDNDELGRQAEVDFYELVNERSQNVRRKRYRVITRF